MIRQVVLNLQKKLFVAFTYKINTERLNASMEHYVSVLANALQSSITFLKSVVLSNST